MTQWTETVTWTRIDANDLATWPPNRLATYLFKWDGDAPSVGYIGDVQRVVERTKSR